MTSAPMAKPVAPSQLARMLLDWYDRHRRRLPWRAAPGVPSDPYRVWLSEIMLQQTTVPVVVGYFQRFLARWPTLEALAQAELDDVLHAWQGLGYYARARNLHACAQHVLADHGGRFPPEEKALRALPGIGRYTAAAIAAIAFDRPATVVDGNVERVMARLRAVETPLPTAKPRLYTLAAELTPETRPGDYAQALMDLGATVCTPRNPGCLACPWRDACEGRARGMAETLPRRAPKRAAPAASRRLILADARGWGRTSEAAAGDGLARRYDRAAHHPLAGGAVDSGGGHSSRAGGAPVAGAARAGAPRLHPFRDRAYGGRGRDRWRRRPWRYLVPAVALLGLCAADADPKARALRVAPPARSGGVSSDGGG